MTNALFATSQINVSAIHHPPVDPDDLQQSPTLNQSRYYFFFITGHWIIKLLSVFSFYNINNPNLHLKYENRGNKECSKAIRNLRKHLGKRK